MRPVLFAAVAALMSGVAGLALAAAPQAPHPGDAVQLNPQPEPPGIVANRHAVQLNPQPEPPGIIADRNHRFLPPGPCRQAQIGSQSSGAGAGKVIVRGAGSPMSQACGSNQHGPTTGGAIAGAHGPG